LFGAFALLVIAVFGCANGRRRRFYLSMRKVDEGGRHRKYGATTTHPDPDGTGTLKSGPSPSEKVAEVEIT